MSDPVYMTAPGDSAIRELNPDKGWARNVGPFITKRWRGAKTLIESKADEVLLTGVGINQLNVKTEEDGIFSTLEVAFQGEGAGGLGLGLTDSAITRTYSFTTVPLQKDLLDLPQIQNEFRKVHGGTGSIDSTLEDKIDLKLQVRAMIDAFFRGVDTVPDPTKLKNQNAPALQVNTKAIKEKVVAAGMDWDNVWLQYFNLRGAGVDHFTTSTFAMTVTIFVPKGASLRIATSNVGRVYSKSTFLTETLLPNNYIAELDNTSVWWKQDVKGETANDGNTTVVESWLALTNYSEFIYGTLL